MAAYFLDSTALIKRYVQERGTAWIRASIESKARKTPPGQRSYTVLALDAQHAGVLATGPGKLLDSGKRAALATGHSRNSRHTGIYRE